MRRIKIALLLTVGAALFGCNTPASAPPASPAPNQPGAAAKTAATTPSVKFVLDPGLKTMVPSIGAGVTVAYDSPISFPLTSPCSEGGAGLMSCTTNNVMGIFPYICDNDACPDPEILVDTNDSGTKGGKGNKTATSGGKKGSNINVPKKMYVECIGGALKMFPDEGLVVSKGTEIYWVSSGASPTLDWEMNPVPHTCKETTIKHGKGNNLCTAQNPTHMSETFTITAPSCNNSSVSGTLEVQ
jgi:hypothetical protein